MKSLSTVIAAAAFAACSSLAAAQNIHDAIYKPLATKLPAVAPNWKVELVTAPPILHWPSVVECAPDGRIFVGEDPMDMPGPGSKPNDRVLCIHPDGQVTVFADHLYAVFGLRYIDGKLYIHHSPKFSVFTDDNGVGKDRKDIWDTDCIATWGGGNLNDHIPSNIRLGMDGWLYMSTGDKGIHGAKSNIDGSTIEIHGGGVARLRPDGSHLEVYSTGTRNHLDLALNAEDEIFTYDNTDDGLGWWTRFTHMVDGGYYGYPHDYRPEESNTADMEWYRKTRGDFPYRPWTLWRMTETGGGSAVGCVGYNEDALPEEYRGNSFNCEWGKSLLQRFHTVRDGGTYKVAKLENVMTSGGSEFHPLGISVTPDGTGFYIADWQMGGWNSPKEYGRLLKLTYTGEMHPAPRPAWYIPAAEGQKFDATLADLVAGLSHPAECVRLVAERRVVEHGKEAIAPLVALLNDSKAPAQGRWSAIWTLDMIDGGKEARSAIIAVAKDDKAELSVRMQAVRELGQARATEAVPVCVELLNHEDAAMRFRAVTALGRIGSPAAVEPILNKLDEKDFFTHFADFNALKRIGLADAKAWPLIVKGFASPKEQTRMGTMLALHEVYDKALVDALAGFVADEANSADARALALKALAPMHRQRPAWDGRWWGTQPQRSPEAPKTVEWAGTPVVLATIQAGLKDSDVAVKKAALDALQIAPDPHAVPELAQLFDADKDAGVRKGVLHALASAKSPEAMTLVGKIFSEKADADLQPDAVATAEAIGNAQAVDALISFAASEGSPEARSAAFAALGKLRAKKAVDVLAKQAAGTNEPLSIAAATALGAIGGRESAEALAPIARDKREPVRVVAIVALGQTQDAAAVEPLLAAAKDPATKNAAITALTKHPDAKAADAYLDGLSSTDAGLRALCRKAIEPIRREVLDVAETRLEKGPPLSKTAVAELQRLYVNNVPLRDWQIIGPFAIESKDAINVTSQIDLKHLPADVKNGDKAALSWKAAHAQRNGMVDLAAQFDPHEHVYAYAVAEVDSPTERDVTLAMGQDDGLILWVNGNKVYEDLGNHGWEADAYHAAAHFVSGRNVIVAKITQDAGPWAFSVSVPGDRKGKLFEVDTKSADVKTYDAYSIGHDGDAAKGSELFHNAQGLGCVKCHTVAGQGGNVGPDLTSVGLKYNRAQLIESVLYPSKQIESGYEQTMIRTKDGNVQSGVVRAETDKEVTLYDSGANKIIIRKADIDTRKISPVSVMPEGLQAGLTHQQFADLIAYLQSLKGK